MEYYDKHGQDVIGWLSSNKFDGKDFVEGFCKWIVAYCDLDFSEMQWAEKIAQNCLNKKIYSDLSDRKKYIQAIIDYMAGMTDVYALNKEHRDMIHQLIRVRFKNKENDENKLRKFIQANSGALE